MSWNLEGSRINGLYMGFLPYSGVVLDSRVKYGGEVQHTVLIDEPIKVYGEVRDMILVGIGEINRVLDELDAKYLAHLEDQAQEDMYCREVMEYD